MRDTGTRPAEAESAPGEVGAQTLPLVDGTTVLSVGTHLGRYLVTGTLGAGGQSFVLAGYDPELNRRVAVKVLRSRAGDERLLREAHALARVTHPNVVVVHDVGVVAPGSRPMTSGRSSSVTGPGRRLLGPKTTCSCRHRRGSSPPAEGALVSVGAGIRGPVYQRPRPCSSTTKRATRPGGPGRRPRPGSRSCSDPR
jgi:hypothetical protein